MSVLDSFSNQFFAIFSKSAASQVWCSEKGCIDCWISIHVESKLDPAQSRWRISMAKLSLRELYLDELRDLYDAENRLVKALPKLAKEAESQELRSGFEEHLEQTQGHVERLQEIFEAMDEKANGKRCRAMPGPIQEGDGIRVEDV